MDKYYKKGIVVLIAIMLLLSSYLGYELLNKKDIDTNSDFEVVSYENQEEKEILEIKIDISGAVKNPGVYTLDSSSRVEDAIIKAGGFSDAVDKELVEKVINRAKAISDGEKIYIPKLGDTADILEEFEYSSGIVNINTASKKELMTLSGIGEAYADRIIQYRKDHKFEDISQIQDVKGIGESLFNKIKDYIRVD